MNILLCEDHKLFAKNLGRQLQAFGKVQYAQTYENASALIDSNNFDAAFIDLNLEGGGSGLNLLKKINIKNSKTGDKTETFIVTCEESDEIVNEAFALGANHYYTKSKLRECIRGDISNTLKAIKLRKLESSFGEIFCTQDKGLISDIKRGLELGVDKNININFKGASGSGKTYAAKEFAKILDGEDAPFENINLSEFSQDIVESELFGHKKGAFTGATEGRNGCFARANKGTLFLDEIHTIGLPLQIKLLKPLGERTVRPVGSSEEINLNDLRVITGTNENLEQLVENKAFKEDLYYRLCGTVITFPPLRARKDDIPLLVNKFIKGKKKEIRLTPCAWKALYDYDWPANVRQLFNILDRALLLSSGMIDGRLIKSILRSESEKKDQSQGLPEHYRELLEKSGYKQLKKEIELAIYQYLKIEKGLGTNEICRSYGIYNSSLTRMKSIYHNRELFNS